MKIHLGHHFFGAGNLGDDFMLGGFLAALPAAGRAVELTCCVPHPLEPLRQRFPQVRWLAYLPDLREACIAACDVWLGLGGAPWQSAVSPWFADHLAGESERCAAHRRPMFFLGVGGQDPAAYAQPALRRAAEQAEGIWTRDERSAGALAAFLPAGRVRAAADLAHIFFAAHSPPPAAPGRLTAVLNFDFGGWPGLGGGLAALARLPARERVWLAQESRPLPGGEMVLYQGLAGAERARWRLQAADSPGAALTAVLAGWPSGEWLLAARFHATLAAAWAGSRAVVLATNDKLAGVAAECGYPLFPLEGDPAGLAELLIAAPRPAAARLQDRAAAAEQACQEFFAAIGL